MNKSALLVMKFAPFLFGLGLALTPVMAVPAYAQDERASLVKQIIEAQQLPSAWSESLAQSAEANTGIAKGVLDQIAQQTGGEIPPPVREAFDRFVAKISHVLTGEEMVKEWSRLYGSQLSIDELREILSFYQSPAGIKSASAARQALPEFQNWLNQKVQRQTAEAFKNFLADLQALR